MQIVIDISEDDYRKVQDGRASVSMMREAIVSGTPLPKGHGRLIDADDVKSYFSDREGDDFTAFHFYDAVENAPTIIEADKGESEE